MNTMFIAGHAKLPTGMAASNLFETLTITAEIDNHYGVIVDASCTLATDHGKDYIARLLKGHSLRHGIDKPLEEVKRFYNGKAANALIAGLKDLYKQFDSIKQ
ncbi:hypothetical protein BIV60_24685 [Bacillus sp. MUM 116]|uniref:DUF3870 domain-containing protein n=1 Tax=Bacillus sp. MUM 116 TaxID=1678002 RepID=UPI0008F5E68F|nr:DUF3870 domain-containing protein [Bacillus sp. MUM 116]OIK09144.1 hypothetical protein BIV60_24685 [Bacillus sp. MUM 116]